MVAAQAAENAGFRNSVTSSAGWLLRRSTTTRTARTARPPSSGPRTGALPHGAVWPPLTMP